MGTNAVIKRILFCVAALALSSCTRGAKTSEVRVSIPKGLGGQRPGALEALPTGYTYCFAINVTAPDISAAGGACQPAMGKFSGFVGEGGVLSLEVPRGANRNFELFLYLADNGTSCPAWNETFNASGKFTKTYSVAKISNYNLGRDVEDITMTVAFPGTQNTVASQLGLTCSGQNQLVAMLYSNGDIKNGSDQTFTTDASSGIWESLFKTLDSQTAVSTLGTQASSGEVTVDGTTIGVAPSVRSVTRKPDTSVYYGLVGDGTIVQVDSTSGAITSLTASTCPFADTSCEVPPWMQSISAGRGTDLFALDHGGQLYQLKAGGVAEALSTVVSPAVSQVSFF